MFDWIENSTLVPSLQIKPEKSARKLCDIIFEKAKGVYTEATVQRVH